MGWRRTRTVAGRSGMNALAAGGLIGLSIGIILGLLLENAVERMLDGWEFGDGD